MVINNEVVKTYDLTYENTNNPVQIGVIKACLLYTSDAADERSSVDLGGRRIIKKKKNLNSTGIGALTHKQTDNSDTHNKWKK